MKLSRLLNFQLESFSDPIYPAKIYRERAGKKYACRNIRSAFVSYRSYDPITDYRDSRRN